MNKTHFNFVMCRSTLGKHLYYNSAKFELVQAAPEVSVYNYKQELEGLYTKKKTSWLRAANLTQM